MRAQEFVTEVAQLPARLATALIKLDRKQKDIVLQYMREPGEMKLKDMDLVPADILYATHNISPEQKKAVEFMLAYSWPEKRQADREAYYARRGQTPPIRKRDLVK
jgi:hypothetical protein